MSNAPSTPRRAPHKGVTKAEVSTPMGVVNVINGLITTGKNIFWVILLIVGAVTIYNNLQSDIKETRKDLDTLKESIQNKNTEWADKQKDVSNKLLSMESKQTEQLVILTELRTMLAASGLGNSSIPLIPPTTSRSKNGNRSTSNNR